MPRFEEYKDKYLPQMRMERDNSGVLLVTLFDSAGGPFIGTVHHPNFGDYTYAFADIGSDPDTELVIIHAPFAEDVDLQAVPQEHTPLDRVEGWFKNTTAYHGAHYLYNLMDIEVPVIGVVSGRATLHAEVVLLSDIVISAPEAIFLEPHYRAGWVPGDGVQIVWPYFVGMNRARYAMLMGKVFTAQEALDIGFVHELCPKDQLIERAQVLALRLLRQSPITRRYARLAITQEIKEKLRRLAHYGLVMEGVGQLERELRREAGL